MPWSRPPGPPRVWNTIDLSSPEGKNMRFVIQEIPEDRYDEAVEHMLNVYSKDEAMHQSIKFTEEAESIAAFRIFYQKLLEKRISIAAYEQIENENSVLAGVNVLSITDKGSTLKIYENLPPKANIIYNAFMDLRKSMQCPLSELNVDLCIEAYGLSVASKYRGCGLGQHILATREKIGKAYNIPLSTTLFSSPVSQRLAEREEYKTLLVKTYDDIVDKDGKPYFPSLSGKVTKYMVKYFQ